MNPLNILRESIKAVPSVKYALAILGIFCVIVIVASFGIDYRVAIFGVIIIIILMIVMLVFARASAASSRTYVFPAVVFIWFGTLFFMAISIILLTSVFFKFPLDLSGWIDNKLSDYNDKKPTFFEWHAEKTRFTSKIHLNQLSKDERIKNSYNLLLVCMKRDDTRPPDYSEDIAKSELFPITQDIMNIDVKFSENFSNEIEIGSLVGCKICLLDKNFSKDDFKTLSDLKNKGGHIYEGVFETIK